MDWKTHLEDWQFATALREAEGTIDSVISENELRTLQALAMSFGDVGSFSGELGTVIDAAVARLVHGWPD